MLFSTVAVWIINEQWQWTATWQPITIAWWREETPPDASLPPLFLFNPPLSLTLHLCGA